MVGRKVNQVSASCVSARQSLALLWRNVLTASVNTSGDMDVTVLIVRGLSALMGGGVGLLLERQSWRGREGEWVLGFAQEDHCSSGGSSSAPWSILSLCWACLSTAELQWAALLQDLQ